MTYKAICQDTETEIKYSDSQIDQEYSDFTNKWKEYSEKIAKYLNLDKNNADNWNELGKLLAIITLQEQDIKNIYDLIETGNKAVILWGPPGTGKTYQAKELIKIMLDISEGQKMEDYRFTLQTTQKQLQTSGAFALVQFHPNYTYEDFVGGISIILRVFVFPGLNLVCKAVFCFTNPSFPGRELRVHL